MWHEATGSLQFQIELKVPNSYRDVRFAFLVTSTRQNRNTSFWRALIRRPASCSDPFGKLATYFCYYFKQRNINIYTHQISSMLETKETKSNFSERRLRVSVAAARGQTHGVWALVLQQQPTKSTYFSSLEEFSKCQGWCTSVAT